MGYLGTHWRDHRCCRSFHRWYREYLLVCLQRAKTIADLLLGHPIETLWGMAKGTCNLQLNTNVSLFFSAIEILTDFSLSLLPAVLLWNVQMVSDNSTRCQI
jgi:hypothetical protein